MLMVSGSKFVVFTDMLFKNGQEIELKTVDVKNAIDNYNV